MIAMEVPLVDSVDRKFYETVRDGDLVTVDASGGTILVLRRPTGSGEAAP